jgi:hypothetical protein
VTSTLYRAVARGIVIEEVESNLEGDIALRGFLGTDKSVRNRFQNIRMSFDICADLSDQESRHAENPRVLAGSERDMWHSNGTPQKRFNLPRYGLEPLQRLLAIHRADWLRQQATLDDTQRVPPGVRQALHSVPTLPPTCSHLVIRPKTELP